MGLSPFPVNIFSDPRNSPIKTVALRNGLAAVAFYVSSSVNPENWRRKALFYFNNHDEYSKGEKNLLSAPRMGKTFKGLTAPGRTYQPPGGHASPVAASHSSSTLAHNGHLSPRSSEGPRGAAIRNLLPHQRHAYSQGGEPVSRQQATTSWMSSSEHRGHFTSVRSSDSSSSNSSPHRLHKYFLASITQHYYTPEYNRNKARTDRKA